VSICREERGGRVYLAEYKSIREGGKVKHKFVRYLGREGPDGEPVKRPKHTLSKIERHGTLRAGDVSVLWHIAEELGFVEIIDKICCGDSHIEGPSPGKLLTIWAINRVLDPESCTALSDWVVYTELPKLAGVAPESLTKDAFLTALDFVCYRDPTSGHEVDHTAMIDDMLYQKWRKKNPLPPGNETVAYDLTSILFFGVTCPLAELGYNPGHVKRRQVNLALLVSKHDKHPLAHFVYGGSRNSVSTVKNLLSRLVDSAIDPGTIIWDRGNVSEAHINSVEGAGWKIICGMPKTSNEIRDILHAAKIVPSPMTFTRKSRSGCIYAEKTKGMLYGSLQTVTVYMNQRKRMSEADGRNEELSIIGKNLDALKDNDWPEKKLHDEIGSIIKDYERFIWTRVNRTGKGARVKWGFRKRELEKAGSLDGIYLLYSTDDLPADEIVNVYLEKDYIEKVFRILKVKEDIEPVRHRLENRVRGVIFVCVLAYRLLSVVQYRLAQQGASISWERAEEVLNALSRVERMEVRYGKQMQIWYLNVTDKVKKSVKIVGYPGLFKDSEIEPVEM